MDEVPKRELMEGIELLRLANDLNTQNIISVSGSLVATKGIMHVVNAWVRRRQVYLPMAN